MNAESENIAVSTTYQLLSEATQHAVIREMVTGQPPETARELLMLIASELDEPPHSIYTELRCRRLPKLDDRGIVEWDETIDRLEKSEDADLLLDYLQDTEEWLAVNSDEENQPAIPRYHGLH